MEIKILNIQQNKDIIYEVEDGETFESIAELFNLPVEYIKQNNSGNLYRGKMLFLPETEFLTYVVKPFDTLQKIANNFGTTTQNLMQKNSLKSEYVFIGQKLYI